MTSLKLKHYFLFFLSFFVFYITDISFGALFLLVIWWQMGFYLWKASFTKNTQIKALFYSILFCPLYFIGGAVDAFTLIYFKNDQYVLLVVSMILLFICLFIMNVFQLSFYFDIKEERSLNVLVIQALTELKNRKLIFFKISFMALVLNILFYWLTSDYKLTLAIILSQIMGKQYLQKLESALALDSTL